MLIIFSHFLSQQSVCVTQFMNCVSVGWLKVNVLALVVPLSVLTISHSNSKVLLHYCQNIYCLVVETTKMSFAVKPML